MRRNLSLLVPLFFLLGALLIPVFFLLLGSFSANPLSAGPPFTLKYYEQALGSHFISIIVNTIVFSVGSAVVTSTLGLLMGWYYGRYVFGARSFVSTLIYLGVSVPVFVQAIGWIFLLSPNNGVINELLDLLFGIKYPVFNVYSIFAMIFVQGLASMPTSFTVLCNATGQLNRQLEHAAKLVGAKHYAIVAKIILPQLSPSFIASFLLAFTSAMESFSVPLFIGVPSGVTVLSTEVYFAVAAGLTPQYGLASVYAVILSLPILFLTLITNRYFTTQQYQYVRGSAVLEDVKPKGWSSVLLYSTITAIALLILLPISVMSYVSVVEYFAPPSFEILKLISLKGYAGILSGALVSPILNTLIYAILAASIGTGIAYLSAYETRKIGGRLSFLLNSLASVNFTFPGVVLGLALVMTYIKTPIYGTMWILVLAYISKYLPLGFKTMLAGLSRIHDEIEEAAIIGGAGLFTRFRSILTPLLKGDLLSSWILIAGGAFQDISMTLFLFNYTTTTVSVDLYTLYLSAQTNDMAAVAIFSFVIFVLLFGILRKLVSLATRQA